MCEYCEFERGNITSEPLLEEEIPLGAFGSDVMNVHILQTSEGIIMRACLGNGSVCPSIKVNYCPICGRKLT